MKHTSIMCTEYCFIIYGGGLLEIQCCVLGDQQNYQQLSATNCGLD
jgi:hypothetical protein